MHWACLSSGPESFFGSYSTCLWSDHSPPLQTGLLLSFSLPALPAPWSPHLAARMCFAVPQGWDPLLLTFNPLSLPLSLQPQGQAVGQISAPGGQRLSLSSLTQHRWLLVGQLNDRVLSASSPGGQTVADPLTAHHCQRNLDQRPTRRHEGRVCRAGNVGDFFLPSGENVNTALLAVDSGHGQLPFLWINLPHSPLHFFFHSSSYSHCQIFLLSMPVT